MKRQGQIKIPVGCRRIWHSQETWTAAGSSGAFESAFFSAESVDLLCFLLLILLFMNLQVRLNREHQKPVVGVRTFLDLNY